VNDGELAFKNDALKFLLNQPPPAKWVKQNAYANNSSYLPIDKTEYLLDKIFQRWNIEVKEVKQMFNGVSVTVRVHYKNPVTGEMEFQDGVGAKVLQTKSETGVLKPDFSNVSSTAIEMALPIAKSSAIKDACDHLGKLFGRDLNRKDTQEFMPSHMDSKSETSASLINTFKKLTNQENV
jgi:hypothetical protein